MRALLEALVVVVVITLIDISVSGYFVFANAKTDQMQRADAIIVLGGDHDGQEDYGLTLARQGWAGTVIMSDPYEDGDPVMTRVCRKAGDVEVQCLRPDPLTTRGEAVMMRRLAEERSWKRIIVVSWRYHLPRARFVFDQCFSDRRDAAVFIEVPRRYQHSALAWEFVYAYQWVGLAKAVAQGSCT